MKLKYFFQLRRSLLVLLPVLALTLGGCSLFSGSGNKPDINRDPGYVKNPGEGVQPRLHIGDIVSITYSGLPDPMDPQDKPIKEDGTITLPDIGRVKAVGKTIGELEDTIHDLYVPKIYTHLNVTVKTSSDRVYYINGEVKSPGRLIYAGTITVSKAITSAGGFTDFASHSSVWLIRANGDRFKLNVDDIMDGSLPDPPVYPNDQIQVNRRLF